MKSDHLKDVIHWAKFSSRNDIFFCLLTPTLRPLVRKCRSARKIPPSGKSPLEWPSAINVSQHPVGFITIVNCAAHVGLHHGLFTNGWETRSRDMWKPVSNRTPGIISKICKLGGGTPAPVCSGLLRPYKISHGLI